MLIYLTFGFYGFFLIFFAIYIWKIIKTNLKCSLKMLYFSNNFKSDMLAILMTLLSCNLTLRNMGKENYFDEKFNKISNIYQSATSHLGNVSRRWLGIRIQFVSVISTIIIYSYGLLLFYFFLDEFLDDRLWVISFIFVWDSKLSRYFLVMLPSMFQARNHLTSYFRIIEYNEKDSPKLEEPKDHLLQETTRALADPSETVRRLREKKSSGKYFPVDLKNRAFELKNINFSYTPGYRVLENLNVEIQSRKRVALIGKQGSGKHSFLNLILKLYSRNREDIQSNDVFKIFGRDIDQLDPHTLRKKVGYLAKEPKMFYGSVRTNIDPFDKFSDAEIIKALHFLRIMEYKATQDIEEMMQIEKNCGIDLGGNNDVLFTKLEEQHPNDSSEDDEEATSTESHIDDRIVEI